MWLINTETLKLEYFADDRHLKGKYAILSHAWGAEEVTFQEFDTDDVKSKLGYGKIRLACQQAREDNLGFCWVDTCCIDKRSSAELSESINSMYRWYANANVCYVYLVDIDFAGNTAFRKMRRRGAYSGDPYEMLWESRWFKRGWTLQELIAPREVHFFDVKWVYAGSKLGLLEALSKITNIDPILKDRSRLHQSSVAQRMSWASNRVTSRLEDEAYCLLGIFNVNMPLLYGEGDRAFFRLQEEIIRSMSWPDHSILAHSHAGSELLATSPRDFQHAANVVSWPTTRRRRFDLSNAELWISSATLEIPRPAGLRRAILLNCSDSRNSKMQYALLLSQHFHIFDEFTAEETIEDLTFYRDGATITCHRSEFAGATSRTISISRKGRTGFIHRPENVRLLAGSLKTSPALGGTWDEDSRVFQLDEHVNAMPGLNTEVLTGLRWEGEIILHLPQALTGPHHAVLRIGTTATSAASQSSMPVLTISLRPATQQHNAGPSSNDVVPLLEDATLSTMMPVYSKHDFDSVPPGELRHEFQEPGAFILQRDGCDVLRFDTQYAIFDGEMMWELIVTELLGTFMVE